MAIRAGQDLSLFTVNPFRTEEWTFSLNERLVAVGYVDALPDALSAIYFFHDPQDAQRSLGTFNILAIIDAARRRGLPYVHLGIRRGVSIARIQGAVPARTRC